MKKTGLFKIIMWVLLGIVVLTWIFSASYYTNGALSDLGMYNTGFFDYFQLLFSSFEFSYFIQILILLVSIGALYGVLGKTGKYRAIIEKITNNFKGAEVIFLFIVAFLFAALSSVFDYGLALFIFIPFVISIILELGYDKITAILATFGATLIGTIGNTFGINTANVIANLTNTNVTDGILFRLGMFVASLALLFFVLSRAKRDNKNVKAAAEEDLFLGEKKSNKYSVAGVIVILSLVFVLMVLGMTAWTESFNIDFFTTLHTKVSEFTIKLPYFHLLPYLSSEAPIVDAGVHEVAIFSRIFGTVNAFGQWYYAEISVICLVAALVLGLLYRVENKFEAMADGIKKMIKPAGLVLLIYTVIYFAGNVMFYPTIASLLFSITNKFNILFSTIAMIFSSALHVDMLYVANYTIPQLAAIDVNSTLISFFSQGIYGVTMFIAPTSVLIALGLSYLGVEYKEWVKRTWKLTLGLFAIVMITTVIGMIVL